MLLLAIDTATRFIGLALHNSKNLIAEQTWQTNNNHTVQLAPAVYRLFEQSEMEIEDLTALAVSTGPGSYTGLRIGIAFAKGIASARKLPLVGVMTLDTLAAGQPNYQSGSGLVAMVQAGRGRVIVKTYKWRKGQWAGRGEPQLMDWETLIGSIDGPAYITGEINDEGFKALEAAKDLPITIAPAAYRLRRAGFLAEVAWEQLRSAGDYAAFAPSLLTPLYVKSEDGAS
jgi:tRNA threonylcarbamoyladenosine biosynthesis protein TsaB